MTEKGKKRIQEEFEAVLQTIKDKKAELIDIRTKEEGLPSTVNEALEEILDGSPEHKASETTNSRLMNVSDVEKEFDTFQGLVLEERSKKSKDEEGEYISMIEDFCKKQISKLKQI